MRSLLNVKQAARILNVHPISLYKLISKKKVPFIKEPGIGVRFDPVSLEIWIRKAENNPSSDKKQNGKIVN